MTLDTGAGVGLLGTMATVRKSTTAGIAAEAPLPRIQVRPIPDMSPPVVDSRAAVPPELSPFIQGTLAISFSGDCDAVANPRDPEDPEDFGPQRTFSSDLRSRRRGCDTWPRPSSRSCPELARLRR